MLARFSVGDLPGSEQVCDQECRDYYLFFYGLVPESGSFLNLSDFAKMLYYHYSNTPIWLVQVFLRSIHLDALPFLSLYDILSLAALLCSFSWLFRLYPYWLYRWGIALIFTNPILAAYFSSVGLEWLSFFCISGMMFAVKQRKMGRFLSLMALLFLSNIKFHFLLFLPFALLLTPQRGRRFWTLSIVLQAGLLIVPLKNAVMMGSFGYSFWLPLNIANNYGLLEGEKFREYPNFGVATPEKLYAFSGSSTFTFRHEHPFYNSAEHNSYNSSTFYILNKEMAVRLREESSMKIFSMQGLERVYRNVLHYFNPLIRHKWAYTTPPYVDMYRGFIPFDSEEAWGNKPAKGISLYTLASVFVVFSFLFFSKDSLHRPFIYLLGFHFLVCILVDGNEGNRMRFAVDPIFIVFFVYGICQLTNRVVKKYYSEVSKTKE